MAQGLQVIAVVTRTLRENWIDWTE